MKHLLLCIAGLAILNSNAQGLLMDEKAYDKLPKWEAAEQQGYSSYLPSKISYRKYAPAPSSQGQVATCTGWAVAYGMLTTQQNLMMQISNPVHRTARAMDPHFIYSLIKDDWDNWCQEGTLIVDAMAVLENYGCKPQMQAPWLTCNTSLSYDEYTLAIASPYRISNYYGLTMDADPVSSVKEALNAKHIVAVGMSLTNSFMTGSAVNYGLWSPTSGEKFIGGHAMCVVGYDDNKYGGSFEIMNSYGTGYGDGGFVWVKYTDFKKYMNQAFIIDISGFQSTGCMNGDCNNFGIYRSTSGDMYEGFMTNGYPDVVGTHFYANGNFYVGQFKNGRKHGYGLFFNSSLARYYSVTFSNDALVESSAIQGFASAEDSKKPEEFYKHLSRFVPGEFITDEQEAMDELHDVIEVPEKPMKIEKSEEK
jgi:hypothetical protein